MSGLFSHVDFKPACKSVSDEFEYLVWKTQIAPQVDGHVLALPDAGVHSLASLSVDARAQLVAAAQKIARMFEPELGPHFFTEEVRKVDGSLLNPYPHVQMVPLRGRFDSVFAEYCRVGGPPSDAVAMHDLGQFANTPYIGLTRSCGPMFVWTRVDRFEPEFVRRACEVVLQSRLLEGFTRRPDAAGTIYGSDSANAPHAEAP